MIFWTVLIDDTIPVIILVNIIFNNLSLELYFLIISIIPSLHTFIKFIFCSLFILNLFILSFSNETFINISRQ